MWSSVTCNVLITVRSTILSLASRRFHSTYCDLKLFTYLTAISTCEQRPGTKASHISTHWVIRRQRKPNLRYESHRFEHNNEIVRMLAQ
ncbi:hypothetical protein KCU65_g438, partial [Aureobasidium melanogenum]